jgi:hypothetical protein
LEVGSDYPNTKSGRVPDIKMQLACMCISSENQLVIQGDRDKATLSGCSGDPSPAWRRMISYFGSEKSRLNYHHIKFPSGENNEKSFTDIN